MPKKPKIEPLGDVVYVGNGKFIIGLPAADMTVEKWESYPLELRNIAIANGLYILGEAIPAEPVIIEEE